MRNPIDPPDEWKPCDDGRMDAAHGPPYAGAEYCRGPWNMRKIALLTLMAGTMLTTTACNTIAGMGRDVSSVGHAVSKTADSAK
jgi:predicted small secreted protein